KRALILQLFWEQLIYKIKYLIRFEVLGPADPVVAVAGEDVVLPCYLKPSISAVDLHIEWFRIQTEDPLVHLYQDHEDRNENQIPSYRGRTSLFPEELRNGNTSLKVKNVRGSDNGQYKCLVQSAECYTISIFIAIGTQPVISIEGYKKGGISLVCESKGWYPQPQVVWMDSEGHNLPAGHTERHTDSMDLFTVRRRVIVQETETNRFTCRVRQQKINEMKETITDVPGELQYFYLLVMTDEFYFQDIITSKSVTINDKCFVFQVRCSTVLIPGRWPLLCSSPWEFLLSSYWLF
uniref:Ig-like domain-containing protein n=1 Tax=Scleropages formosus TaxID=113540 RepID=A0A8C9SLS9_SCLFO